MLERDQYRFHKKHTGTHFAELVFLNPMGSTGHVVNSNAFVVQNVDALFFMIGWDTYGFDKRHTATCYAELLFLHLLASAGQVVHSGASGT
jgi:hypothetical protein